MTILPSAIRTISLRRLFPGASFVGCADIGVQHASEVSGECRNGSLFAVRQGRRFDGREFIDDAIANGAKSLLVQQPVANAALPQCVVPQVSEAFSTVVEQLAGSPSNAIDTIGVTGTNGKTTVTWLLRSIFQAAGSRCGLIGTIEYDDCSDTTAAPLTTPDARTTSQLLATMRANQASSAAIELSSHALDQRRVAAVQLAVGVVTNVTHDHFDYHGNLDNYVAAKARIAGMLKPGGVLVLNADDPGCRQLFGLLAVDQPVRRFAIDGQAEVRATDVVSDQTGSRFRLESNGRARIVHTPMLGRHNVLNCLAAATVAEQLGVSLDDIANGIASLKSVPGRLERVDVGQNFHVYVDYAHTPDALHRVVQIARTISSGRVICVFGAGGDRDASKRPLLGQAASGADTVIVTSDNPRSEDPSQIISEILPGVRGTRTHIECDRQRAIEAAIQEANAGDCVLIVGKGHETIQIVDDRRLQFDDRLVARAAIVAQLGNGRLGRSAA